MGRVGAAISRDRDAYNYLARTVKNFRTAEELRSLCAAAGFVVTAELVHSFGIARSFVLERSA
jgi:ubiquinone/menaquinone biosynthesis C-methylase UbiE